MSLQRQTMTADEVRAPAVPRGRAIIVTRYREDVAKVALVNPEDLAMLEESHDLLGALETAAPPSLGKLIAAARKGSDSEFSFLVPGKARPVLVVSDRVDERLREVLALRLLRLGSLTAREREIVRSGEDPGLYHLDSERFDLPEENAAIVAALVRVHRSAIDPQPVGRLGDDELRVVHERVATYYGLDLRQLVRHELQRLGEAQRRRG